MGSFISSIMGNNKTSSKDITDQIKSLKEQIDKDINNKKKRKEI